MRKYIVLAFLLSVMVILFVWNRKLKKRTDDLIQKDHIRTEILDALAQALAINNFSTQDSAWYSNSRLGIQAQKDTSLVRVMQAIENYSRLQRNQQFSEIGISHQENKMPIKVQNRLPPFGTSALSEKDSLLQVAAWLEMEKQLAEKALEQFKKTSDSLLQILSSRETQTGVLYFSSPQGVKIQYVGEIKNGKAHGFGMGIWETGHKYEGYWQDGMKEGNGIYRFANGEAYCGIFVSNKRLGNGVYFFKNGDRYAGAWNVDVREGLGAIVSKTNRIIKAGIWKNDRLVQNRRLDKQEEQNLLQLLEQFELKK